MGVYLIGVYLIGVYLMSVYLMSVHLIVTFGGRRQCRISQLGAKCNLAVWRPYCPPVVGTPRPSIFCSGFTRTPQRGNCNKPTLLMSKRRFNLAISSALKNC